jgi:hypothetical protein
MRTTFASILRIPALAVVLATAPVANTTQACAFDLVPPEKSSIDWIVEADRLVLARPRPDNKFAFGVTEVLIGEMGDIELPGLVDSKTRRMLTVNPRQAILFARIEGGDWKRVATIDETFRPILEAAMRYRGDWAGEFDEGRKEFIEELQDNADPRVKALVIAELDKMPYEMLRRMDMRIPPDELISELWMISEAPYQAIRALLLGLSDDEAAHREIHDFINRVEDRSLVRNLGAFAAALIEIDGVAGVEKLASGMLLDPSQPLEKLEQILMALSVQNVVAEREVRDAIGIAVADFVALRPEGGAIVARQFATRSDWSQAAVLQQLLQDQGLPNATDLLTVSVYLAQARQAAAIGSEDEG